MTNELPLQHADMQSVGVPRKPKVRPVTFRNMITRARGSVGSNFFRRCYCEVDGVIKDVLQDGNLSCAYHVSFITHSLGLSKGWHVTVAAALKDWTESGWQEICRCRIGSIIVYAPRPADPERMKRDGETHSPVVMHVGIYVGRRLVVTNSDETRVPELKPWNYRPVEKYLWHPKLWE